MNEKMMKRNEKSLCKKTQLSLWIRGKVREPSSLLEGKAVKTWFAINNKIPFIFMA